MLPDRVSNPGPLTYESGALPIALRGPAKTVQVHIKQSIQQGNVCFMVSYPLDKKQLDKTLVPRSVFTYSMYDVLLFYVHGKHLRSCRDGQLT